MQKFRDLPLGPGKRRKPALRHFRDRSRRLRPDGPRRADQDQERGRPDADLPPLVPRGDLRIVRDEHERQERPRLHHRDRGPDGRDSHHPAAAHGRGQGPGARLHPLLRAIRLDPSVAADGHPERRAARNGCRAPNSARSSTASTSASCAPAARPRAPATGGIPTSSSARRSCCRPIAGWPTAATR